MDSIVDFLIETGKLKKMKRRGWVLNRVKNPETIGAHIFRTALMGWILSSQKKNFNIERVLKIALVHDLCEVYAGDTTPFDSIISKVKNKKELEKLVRVHPRFTNGEKQRLAFEKHKKEWQALVRLTERLDPKLRKEMIDLWLDYEEGNTKEGRFVNQADRMENLLQALEYWREDKDFPIKRWWVWAKELFSDPLLLDFMDLLDKKFHSEKASRANG